jgi:hypothetical protein
MRQIRIAERRHRPGGGRREPLPSDPRDPDIVRAHDAARRSARSQADWTRSGGGLASSSNAMEGAAD